VQGAGAYLAAPGGFDATPVMGSKATVCREGLGGLNGSGLALTAGDRLGWSAPPPAPRELEATQIPDLSSAKPLETVLGAQIADFAGQSLFDAFNSPWQVDSRADRMGVRLLGPALHYQGTALISEGIPLGAIQVPPDGQPIILLNDRQTIGGYPRLGALTPRSLARLAQCLPGAELRLSPVVQEVAHGQHLRMLAQWH
ncbi:allophanate hydrolase, partial [Pseudomonas sp. Pseusp3]